jgi:hypothetical protein
MHGYNNTDVDMRAIFLAMGPAFKQSNSTLEDGFVKKPAVAGVLPGNSTESSVTANSTVAVNGTETRVNATTAVTGSIDSNGNVTTAESKSGNVTTQLLTPLAQPDETPKNSTEKQEEPTFHILPFGPTNNTLSNELHNAAVRRDNSTAIAITTNTTSKPTGGEQPAPSVSPTQASQPSAATSNTTVVATVNTTTITGTTITATPTSIAANSTTTNSLSLNSTTTTATAFNSTVSATSTSTSSVTPSPSTISAVVEIVNSHLVPAFDNVEIYNLLAYILKIKPAKTNGTEAGMEMFKKWLKY